MYHKLRQKCQNEAVFTNYCRIWCPKEKKFLYFPDIFETLKYIYIYQILHIIVTLATLMLRRFHEIYFLREIKRKRNFKQNSPSHNVKFENLEDNDLPAHRRSDPELFFKKTC